jgi:hypothetical protein
LRAGRFRTPYPDGTLIGAIVGRLLVIENEISSAEAGIESATVLSGVIVSNLSMFVDLNGSSTLPLTALHFCVRRPA